jgi:hypothetical protein
METAIIVNGILVTVFSLGFLSYTVWLGFKVVRLSGELKQLEYSTNSRAEETETMIGHLDSEVWRNFDKVDSRFDQRITDELRGVWNDFEVHNNRFIEIESVLNNTNKD